MANYRICFALPLLAASTQLHAQVDEAGSAPVPGEGPEIVVTATGNQEFGPPKPQLQIVSGIEDGEVKLTFSTESESWENFGRTDASLTFSAPYDKNEKRGSFLTETGLPGAYSIAIAGSINLLSSDLNPARDLNDQFYQRRANLSADVARQCILVNEARAEQDRKPCTGVTTTSLLDDYATPSQKSELLEMQRKAENALLNSAMLLAQANATYGREVLKYRDPATFVETKDGKDVFSLSASLLYIPKISDAFGFMLGGEYERKYKLPSAENRCQPQQPGETFLRCFNSSYGIPTRDTAATLFAGIKFAQGAGPVPFAGSVKFAIDPSDGEWGFEAPLLVFQDKDKKFNGGLRIGYESEDDDFFFGVFIGRSFDFLKF